MIVHTRITRLSLLNTAVAKCRECPRHLTRSDLSLLPGPVYAKLLILVSAPDTTGKPDGVSLRPVLRKLKINPDTVYTSTVLKCFSPKKPKDVDVDACRDHLNTELRLVMAPVIMTCGELATQSLLPEASKKDVGIAFVQYNGTLVIPNLSLHKASNPVFIRVLKDAYKRAGAYGHDA